MEGWELGIIIFICVVLALIAVYNIWHFYKKTRHSYPGGTTEFGSNILLTP